MKRYFNLLWVVLALQLGLAAWFMWQGERAGGEPDTRPLLATPIDEVDRMVIGDAEGTVTLQRVGGHWQLLSSPGLPAEQEKVREVLGKISASITEWPVATTTDSQERLEVSAEKFQRHIQLYRGQESLAGFYLGTSPGFRQVHLRREGDYGVYVVELAVNDLPANVDAWVDKSLLAVADLTRITAADYTLASTRDDGWEFEQPLAGLEPPSAAADDQAAKRLASALSSLRVQSLAEDAAAEMAEGENAIIRVEAADGSYVYRFTAADGEHYVKRDDIAATFVLSQYEYNRIAGLSRTDLLSSSSDGTEKQGKTAADELADEQAQPST